MTGHEHGCAQCMIMGVLGSTCAGSCLGCSALMLWSRGRWLVFELLAPCRRCVQVCAIHVPLYSDACASVCSHCVPMHVPLYAATVPVCVCSGANHTEICERPQEQRVSGPTSVKHSGKTGGHKAKAGKGKKGFQVKGGR